MLMAASAAIAVTLWLPGGAAQTGSPPAGTDAAPATAGSTARTEGPITFDQYRDWRLNFMERRRSELAVRLSASDLPERQKARLEQVKAYYDWLAGLPDSERDRRFRARFDRIDANHDGKIDAAERAAWREKQRAFYERRGTGSRPQPAAADAETN
jgi:hypothetical protein